VTVVFYVVGQKAVGDEGGEKERSERKRVPLAGSISVVPGCEDRRSGGFD